MNNTLNKFIHRHHFTDAEAYDRHAGKLFRGIYRSVAEDVVAAAPVRGVVLDAGCGSGRLAVEIARRRPDLRGIDLEAGMVDVATRHAKRENLTDRVEFTVADLANLPLPDDSVDLIVSTASLHHWSDVPRSSSALRSNRRSRMHQYTSDEPNHRRPQRERWAKHKTRGEDNASLRRRGERHDGQPARSATSQCRPRGDRHPRLAWRC